MLGWKRNNQLAHSYAFTHVKGEVCVARNWLFTVFLASAKNKAMYRLIKARPRTQSILEKNSLVPLKSTASPKYRTLRKPPQTIDHDKILGQASGLVLSPKILKEQIYSPELWLGFCVGVVTRVATTAAILASFEGKSSLSSAMVGFLACGGSGVFSGVVVYLVRQLYRNANITDLKKKEIYLNKALAISALTGFFGGILGGCFTNTVTMIARAGRLALSIAGGVLLGVPYALMMDEGDWHKKRSIKGWGKWVLQGAAFGAAGGILGILCVDLFTHHNALVASTLFQKDTTPLHSEPLPAYTPTAAPTDATLQMTPTTQQDQLLYLRAVEVANHALPHTPK